MGSTLVVFTMLSHITGHGSNTVCVYICIYRLLFVSASKLYGLCSYFNTRFNIHYISDGNYHWLSFNFKSMPILSIIYLLTHLFSLIYLLSALWLKRFCSHFARQFRSIRPQARKDCRTDLNSILGAIHRKKRTF